MTLASCRHMHLYEGDHMCLGRPEMLVARHSLSRLPASRVMIFVPSRDGISHNETRFAERQSG